MESTFQTLELIAPLLQSIAEQGYTEPTDIQKQTIPVALSGRNIIACAQTGTGKSAAFCLPLLQHLHQSKSLNSHTGIKALILAPTRELAMQISDSFTAYGNHTCLNHTAIFGGIPRKVQIDYLSREIDILIATPGRLLDLADKGIVKLDQVSHFVLDEADSMLNLGFIEDVERVIALLPTKRQTMLFSATIPYEIATLAKAILIDPVSISSTPTQKSAINVTQHLYWVDSNDTTKLLEHLLQTITVESAFIFTATKSEATTLSNRLTEVGHRTEAIHSDRSQRERQEALERFKNRETQYLVATDVVARGIDVDNVSHVFNIGLPQECDSYVHRIGRTGRAGNNGIAITFCAPTQMEKLRKIERLIKQKISVVDSHPCMNLALRRKLFEMEDSLEKRQHDKNRVKKRRK